MRMTMRLTNKQVVQIAGEFKIPHVVAKLFDRRSSYRLPNAVVNVEC